MAAVRPPRRLFLHLSALSDAEYAIYIEALRDLLDDEDNEGVQDQKPVENDKTGCDMVLLHDCEYGHEECDEKEDSGDETA